MKGQVSAFIQQSLGYSAVSGEQALIFEVVGDDEDFEVRLLLWGSMRFVEDLEVGGLEDAV